MACRLGVDGRREEGTGYFCILTLKSADSIVSDWPAASVWVRNWQCRALSFWAEGEEGRCGLMGRGGASSEGRALPFKSSAQRGAATPKEVGGRCFSFIVLTRASSAGSLRFLQRLPPPPFPPPFGGLSSR